LNPDSTKGGNHEQINHPRRCRIGNSGNRFLEPCRRRSRRPKKVPFFGDRNPGGTFYFIGAGFANLFNKKVPGVRVIAESTAASEENFHYVLRKKMDMGLISIHVIEPALEKKMDLSAVRLSAWGIPATGTGLSARIPHQDHFRLQGQKSRPGSPGSGTLVSSKMELGAAGKLGLEDFKPAYLSFTESITAIKDGTVDVGVISAGYPVASLLDLARTVPIRLIPYTEQELKAIMDAHPFYVKVVIPAGTYQGIDSDTLTRGIVTAIFCRQEMTEDLVYQMMKALYDNPKEKDVIHPQARQWNLENMFRGAEYTTKYIPFHSEP